MHLKVTNDPLAKNKHSKSHSNPFQGSLGCKSFHHLLIWCLYYSNTWQENTKDKKPPPKAAFLEPDHILWSDEVICLEE